MQLLKFIVSLALTIGLAVLLSRPLTIKTPVENDTGKTRETIIPPLGHFFSPFSGFWQNAESASGFEDKEIDLPDFEGNARVIFDDRMVPHIFADNLKDAIYVQGYITAMQRLWQMDMVVRVSGGTLAEVLGPDLIEADRLQRKRGMMVGANENLKSWETSPEEFAMVESYMAGVNAFVRNMTPASYPLEFKLLNYKPELWSAFKSALVKKYMDQTLCFDEDDIESTNALKVLGTEMFQKLYPEYNPKQSPVIPAGTPWNFEPVKQEDSQPVLEAIGTIPHEVYPKIREIVGSNNWAVAGSKTASGNPILANDPHLQLSLPSIWYEIQIHTPEANFYGVSIPGIPGVLIGFNEDTAWGETNVGHDVMDWYTINWTDDSRSAYHYDGEIRDVNLVVEKIAVRGKKEPVLDTVRWTVWGPVVYETKGKPKYDMAMRWLALDAPSPGDIGTFLGLNKGKNYNDYINALANYDYPAQNFVFASKSGDIAITVNGKHPIKNAEQGRYVQDGSQSANGWKGWIPRDQIPKILNPQQGFVASANQHSTDRNYPYYYNSSSFDHFRGRYLAERLTEMNNVTKEDMMALQNSNVSILAREGLPALLRNVETSGLNAAHNDVLAKLQKWDFSFDAEKTEPFIFETWWNEFYKLTFDEVLIWNDSIAILRPENWRLVKFILAEPGDVIFDNISTPQKETLQNIATESFIAALDKLKDKLSDATYTWAKHKGTSIMHLARIPSFSRQNLNVGGYKQALNAISETHGPSWRMVVELGEDVKGWGVFPGGQSGNPGSAYYETGIEKWMKGEYNELNFMKNAEDSKSSPLFTFTFK